MQVEQVNIEFFFRLLYNCLHGSCLSKTPISYAEITAWLAHVWLWIIIIGYALSVIGIAVIVYFLVRLFELRARETEYYKTLLPVPEKNGTSERWSHIQSLANGTTASEWREAIIEADIMLNDLLLQEGYVGETVGDKLKSVDPHKVKSLNDAWEAHKVRNQIAHEGSSFALSDSLTRRTIARYEQFFSEFGVV